MGASRAPHPIPYQGSKRLLAEQILSCVENRRFRALFEPFAGSAAITIAAAMKGLASEYRLSDTLQPLIQLWDRILQAPDDLASDYERLWSGQLTVDGVAHFNAVRDQFNTGQDPAALLYLLARCVKNAPRFNRDGAFNQSPDKRRKGMRPAKMRAELKGVSSVLKGRATARSLSFEEALHDARPDDLVYLDPPWEGTSTGRDRRYHTGLERERLIAGLHDLRDRGIPFLLSYDGRCGEKTYGPPLPSTIDAVRLELHAGRSSQATLLGRDDVTVESLYVSKALVDDGQASALSETQLTLIST